mmetsp:Transcript_49738/g.116190  ORF Transcript_49738/g.116190 Transcript_49738/m.116190 type:complete len:523 (+) Transcript_49738:52-1620(+)
MDVFLLVLVLVIFGLAIVTNLRLLTHYQQPEDSGFATSPICKVVIIASLTLAWMVNLLLPIDVRNSRPNPGFLDMAALWSAAFITLAVFLVLIVPAAMFYYEVEGDDTVKRKRRHVLCSLSVALVFAAVFLGISFPFLSQADIPVVTYSCQDWQAADEPLQLSDICGTGKKSEIEVQVGLQIYIVSVLCFLGWFFLSIFGAIGLSAAPIDMILAFVDRPRAIDEGTYRQRKKMLGLAAGVLLQRADELQTRDEQTTAKNKGSSRGRFSVSGWRAGQQMRQVRTDYNRFKCDVHLLEEEFESLQISKFQKGESLVVAVLKLILGILFAILSLAWVLQIIICVLVPQITGEAGFGFLNDLFSACETSGLYPLGVALYACFNFYMLICVVQGCTKLGMRVAFLISIHPMRVQNTPLNSILFNVEMLLVSTAAMVQFSQTAFSDYARLTEADVIFSAQIQRLRFYSFFFQNHIFIITMLVVFVLSLIYFVARPRDRGSITFKPQSDSRLAKMIGASSPKPGTASQF